MIVGIGTDLVSIDRIANILLEKGDRFIDRCFSPEERAFVDDRAGDPGIRAGGYAKRWAAKEACAKALGMGIRDDIILKDIVVVNDRLGKPTLILKGGAKERLTTITPEGKNARIDISLSDEAGMAVAFVIISVEPRVYGREDV
jgi:holo-[acyl-carrier protein] synthase